MTRVLPEEEAPPQGKDDVVLSVQGVSKKFCRSLKKSLFYGVQDIFGELLGVRESSDTLRSQEFWALKDISFELRRGEALGLVGANGAGKTTLLRMIAGLIKPDHGTVDIKGRIAPLIALRAGFNPTLTGRENIYTNMSLLGLSKQEIDDRFQEVVDFAEIDSAIDAPVQSYSSGMQARLGFACAIHVEPDILLIDEVLAVGDVYFKAKCFRKLYELCQEKVSFILVSHSSTATLNTCTKAIHLQEGSILSIGSADQIIREYEKNINLDTSYLGENGLITFHNKTKEVSKGVDITYLYLKDYSGQTVNYLTTASKVTICIGIRVWESQEDLGVHLIINKNKEYNGTVLYLCNNYDQQSFQVKTGKYEVNLEMPILGLKPGSYNVQVWLRSGLVFTFDVVKNFPIIVHGEINMSKCLYYQPRNWEICLIESD